MAIPTPSRNKNIPAIITVPAAFPGTVLLRGVLIGQKKSVPPANNRREEHPSMIFRRPDFLANECSVVSLRQKL